jgi:hypothetical protein
MGGDGWSVEPGSSAAATGALPIAVTIAVAIRNGSAMCLRVIRMVVGFRAQISPDSPPYG